MKLPAPAPLVCKRLATACTAALAIVLLACAGSPAASAGSSGVATVEQSASSESPVQTLPQGPSIAPSVQYPGAPEVSLAMTPGELDFLLTDEERALVSGGATAQVQLEATPLVPNIPIPPSSNIEAPAESTTAPADNGSGEDAESKPAGETSGALVAFGSEESGAGDGIASQQRTLSQPAASPLGVFAASSEERRPPASPPLMLIEPEDLAVMTIAAEQLYNFSGTDYKSGYTPFDITLSVRVGSSTRKVTGTLPTPIKLNVTLTKEIIDGTRGMGETFCFVVFHEYRDENGTLTAEQVSLELGSEEKLTVPVAVQSFSPFIIAWGDVPPIPAPPPGGGGEGTGGSGTASGSGSGGGGTSGGTPSTPVPPQTPEPAPPAANDSAPEAAAPATPARPFLAWSPSQTRRSIALRWTPAEGADGYLVYGCRCNHGGVKRTPVLITELGPSATSWTERRLPAGEWHKYVVRAFCDDGGRHVVLARSPQVHAATLGGKSRTARGVQITSVRDESGALVELREPEVGDVGVAAPNGARLQVLELTAGQQVHLSARELGRKLTVHHRGMRFALWSTSACGAPITSKDGNFTLQQPGTYLLWAYAQSGTHHMIEVRVQE